jgi:hypothetical protein
MLLSQKTLACIQNIKKPTLLQPTLFKHAIRFFPSISFQIGPELIGAILNQKNKEKDQL